MQSQAAKKRAQDQFLAASFNLAKAHEQKAVGILNEPETSRDTQDYQHALLQALQAQRQEIGGKPALRFAERNRLGQAALDRAFTQRWVSPSLRFNNSVTDLTFSPDRRLLASASADNTVRLSDLQTLYLLLNGPAPSARATLISEALQRLWGLRFDGLDIVPESWALVFSRDGYDVDQDISIPIQSPTQSAETGAEPETRTFNIRPLLDPPRPGEDKLDQLLRWLKDQGM